MKLTVLRSALFLAALLLPASVACAQTLTPGSGWQYFSWQNCSSLPCGTSPTTWTLDLSGITGRTELRIVDAFTAGDMFQVTVSPYPPNYPGSPQIVQTNSSWVPLSTNPEYMYLPYYSPLNAQDDPDVAWSVDKYFSRFAAVLPAGNTYTITISVSRLAHDPGTYAAITTGGAYIRATCVGGAGSTCPADTMSPLSMAVVSPFSTRAVGSSVGSSLRSTGPPWTINGYPAGKGQ